MVKLIYIAEDDDYLGLKTNDVFWAEPLENGDGYIYTDKFGTKLFVENWEVEEIVESPVEWCRRMQDETVKVEDALNYYKLAEMWMERRRKMNIVGYDPASYTEGPGIRVAVWVSGCPHHCKGCFNAHYFDPKKGTPFSEKHLDKIFQDLDNNYIEGISFLGGEPLAPYNVEGILSVMREIRKKFGDKKTILVYTGYVLEELPIWVRAQVECLADMIIDGRYEKDLPTKKPFRGSDNQCFYVKKDNIWHKVD